MTSAKTFDQWMRMVDAFLYARCGLSSADLPDCCYADWFDSGMSASSAAKRALRAAAE